MEVFCFQLDIVWEDKRANFERLENLLAGAKPPAGSLVVLPEMCFTGFSMNVRRIAEHEPEYTETFLAGVTASGFTRPQHRIPNRCRPKHACARSSFWSLGSLLRSLSPDWPAHSACSDAAHPVSANGDKR